MGTYRKVALCLATLLLCRVSAQLTCTDVRGWEIKHGMHYVPGPDTCKLCICDNGNAKFCKAVLCSPPQDCRSFRLGNSCCDFICLDDVVKPPEEVPDDLGLKLLSCAVFLAFISGIIVAMCKLSHFLRKTHRNTITEDQHSLNSIGYISGGYVRGVRETAVSTWKPHNYLPRGEAPPPYDEVVALTRAEAARPPSEPSFHRSYQASMEVLAHDDATHYLNISRSIAPMSNPGCFNTSMQSAYEPSAPPHRMLSHNVTMAYPSAIRLTGSLGTITNRGLLSLLQRDPDRERPHNVPGFYAIANPNTMHHSLHRTIPRMSTSVDATLLDAPLSGFNREPSLCGVNRESALGRWNRENTLGGLARDGLGFNLDGPVGVRRSFHKPHDNRRNLNFSSDELTRVDSASQIDTSVRGRPRAYSEEQSLTKDANQPKMTTNTVNNGKNTIVTFAGTALNDPTYNVTVKNDVICHLTGLNIDICKGSGNNNANDENNGSRESAGNGTGMTNANMAQSLPLTVDQPSCVCSYAGEEEDYRSECENCKAATASVWASEAGAWQHGPGERTQTLQRLQPPPPPPPPHTATLPQPVARPSHPLLEQQPSSTRNSWLRFLQDSDTESEDE